LTSGSRFPIIYFDFRKSIFVMYFDFLKSTSGNIFWLPKVEFRLYILISESQLSVKYFYFWKLTSSYILTFESIFHRKSTSKNNFGVWRNTWRCRKPRTTFSFNHHHYIINMCVRGMGLIYLIGHISTPGLSFYTPSFLPFP